MQRSNQRNRKMGWRLVVRRFGCLEVAKAWTPALCGFLLLAMAVAASGQDLASKDELYTGKEFVNAFANPKDDPDLPNVLLIGDSISIGYTVDVRKRLLGKADVFRIPSNGKYASHGSKNLDKWLGKRKWDVIHFNWGLWDICYRNPKSKTQGHRDKVTGTLTASPDQYRESMEKIVARLKKTNATLIWCATTPVPEHEAGRKLGDEIKYNAIAKSIMLENDILINDLYAHALKRLPEIQKQKGDVHFNANGYTYLAEQVAQAVFAALANNDTVPNQKPNFVVIFTDDQGYQDVGCFGSPDIRTPRLDSMAREGIKFTDFYAQSICGPSRAALMTGCYPMRVAERGNTKEVHTILHSDEITIAEVLKTEGYATACFGKWDLAKHAQTGFFMDLFPTRQGFDCFYGTPTSNDRVANLYRNENLIEPATELATLTRRYTDEAISFMKQNQDKPFFVYLPHTMPHTKLAASKRFKGKSPRGLYGDVIEELDFNVGRLIDAIKEMGLSDNTYVLFTSDNGPWLNKNKNHADGHLPKDHGGSAGKLRSGKVSSFEGGIRVPTILWGPGRVPAGETCDKLACTLDVLPTLAALAGAKVPDDRVIDGEDISHLFHGDFAAANQDKAFFYYLRVHLQAVRQGNWKLHLPREAEPIGAAPFSKNLHIAPADRIGFKTPFLIDLNADIGETTNVADQHPDVVKRLLGLAEAMRVDLGDYNRVGKNMRFYDLDGRRPTKPPLPAPKVRKRKPKKKKKERAK